MENDILNEKLQAYGTTSPAEENHALKEIVQECVLAALAQTDFFEHAAFQGGTCLRIIYQIPRFSEDLDFVLKSPKDFSWNSYLDAIRADLAGYNLTFSSTDRSNADKVVQQAFLKEESMGQQLEVEFERKGHHKKIKIKLEADSNPPDGSDFESKFLDFPFPYSVECQDLPSLFASKCHALLCRPYPKGRDWYDLIWYVNKGIQPNMDLLSGALKQTGPYQGISEVTLDWLKETLADAIQKLNMSELIADAERFVYDSELRGLKTWGVDYFKSVINKIDVP